MERVFRKRVTVQPGGRIELQVPDLPAGLEVEVIVFVQHTAKRDLSPLDLAESIKDAKAVSNAIRRTTTRP